MSFHDLDMKNWKQYEDLWTDSLWTIPSRGSQSGSNDYHGNFVPQIPYQLIKRFTKESDAVLDLFLGSGTTMVEAIKQNRRCFGVELDQKVINETQKRIEEQTGARIPLECDIYYGDSADRYTRDAIDAWAPGGADLTILHPPYWDIVAYGGGHDCLSSAKNLHEFLGMWDEVWFTAMQCTRRGGHIALVIGDVYKKGEVIPLSHHITTNILRDHDPVTLKAIIVKDIQGNEKAKGKNKNLWRYRCLKNGLYVFKHEYIYIWRVK